MKKIALTAALLATCSMAFAQQATVGSFGEGQSSMGSVNGERPHGPPPEIMAACAGKPMGTQVSVTFRDGKSRVIACGEHHHHHHGEEQGTGMPQ